jgi:hypothetical protein
MLNKKYTFKNELKELYCLCFYNNYVQFDGKLFQHQIWVFNVIPVKNVLLDCYIIASDIYFLERTQTLNPNKCCVLE